MLRSSLQRLADTTLVSLIPGNLLYADGFGDRCALDASVERIREARPDQHGGNIEVVLEAPRSERRVMRQRGSFVSPLAAELPVEAERARIEILRPTSSSAFTAHAVPHRGAERRACLLLAATGEEGFWWRRRFAMRLVESGITVVLLENPFYGSRRPARQRGPLLRTVAAQFAMNHATVEEARAVLRWLRHEGHTHVGVTGHSQGGVMAAFVAALSVFPVAVVPRCAGNSAAPIFTSAALSKRIDWARLARDAGSEDAARRYFADCLEPVRVDRYPAPRAPRAAILVSAKDDGFIPRAEAEALQRHWPGSQLRWLDTFHVAAAVGHNRAHHNAIRDAFTALEDESAVTQP